MTRQICDVCAHGVHPHDTFTGARRGEDAGCPRSVDGHECRCEFRLPTTPPEGNALTAWIIETVLGVELLSWQRAYLAKWVRR